MLTFRQFEVVRAVMQSATVTEAARRLGITQPAASRALRGAEDRLGTTLFIRAGGRLRPSEEAWILYPFIEKLFDSLTAAQGAATDIRGARSRRLRVVSTPSIASCILPFALERLQRRVGAIDVAVHSLANFEAASAVAGGRADIGFVFVPPDYPDLEKINLGSIPIFAGIPSGHRLAGRDVVQISDLDEETVISLSRNLPIGTALHNSLQGADLSLRLSIEVSDSFTACSLASSGLGVALVDTLSIRSFPGLVAKPLDIRSDVKAKALLAAGHRRTHLASLLLDEVRETSAGIMQGWQWGDSARPAG